MLDDPSPVIEMMPPGVFSGKPLAIPEDEAFRMRAVFETQEYAVPEQYIPSGPLTIVDIGANVGLFALYMKHVGMDGQILCFEPAPQTVSLLEKNTAGHHDIHIFPYALSDHEGTAQLYLHPCNSGENSLKTGATQPAQSVRVPIKDAATMFQHIGLTYIDIVKIDTEGSEIEILRSLKPYLPYMGIVMVEYHSDADRRRIDAMLGDHLMFDARIYTTQLGVLKYINSRLFINA